jgi:hypothetical protein
VMETGYYYLEVGTLSTRGLVRENQPMNVAYFSFARFVMTYPNLHRYFGMGQNNAKIRCRKMGCYTISNMDRPIFGPKWVCSFDRSSWLEFLFS